MKIEETRETEEATIFLGKINDKEFKASYSEKPYFIAVYRTDTRNKPLTKEERENICEKIKEEYIT